MPGSLSEPPGRGPVTSGTFGAVSLWQRLDPRLHLAAAIGWSVFVVVTLAALVAASLAAGEAESRVRVDSERLLTQFAVQVRQALAASLATRQSVVQATAAQILASNDRGNQALRRHLDAVQAQFPEFAWLGVADEQGRVTAATGGLHEGDDVSHQRWFTQGRAQAVGRIGAWAAMPGTAPSPVGEARVARVIDLAMPLTHAGGITVGVLGGQLSWAWVERLLAELRQAVDASRPLDVLLLAEDGTVLVGPSPWLGRPLPSGAALSQGGVYLLGQRAEQPQRDGGFGWSVLVRQDARTALAPARSTRQVVFFSVLLAGLAAAAVAVWATQLLTRRLSALAAQAQAVRSGTSKAIRTPAGKDEVSRIGATLAEAVDHLQQEKQALQTLNAELDARVIERTARIERLADDARHAAVTRERLRLARDLHDTLAHSLMALLTQIRLVRKLRRRWSDAELEGELARAEDVAASGLTEARAAIKQMRHSGVRETGLGAALQDLLKRFGERCGVAARLQAEPAAAELANERAETVFRIAEEALHNVERHAQAQSLLLTLGLVGDANPGSAGPGGPQRLRLTIIDDGVGFDPAQPLPGHYGLRGMAEQAELISARLTVRSQPGHGTHIDLEFDA
jgi:signal transduction histidine kinase